MKIKILLISFALPLFFCAEPCAAQWPVNAEDIVADAQEVQPIFRGGGINTFTDWVQKQVIYFQNFNSPKGIAKLAFTVDNKGKICDLDVESHDPELTDALLKAIGKAPKMTPGTRNGEPSAFRLLVVINFDRHITSEYPNLIPKPDSKPKLTPGTDRDSSNRPSDKAVRSRVHPRFSKSGKEYDRERDMERFTQNLIEQIYRNQSERNESGKVEINFIVNHGGYIENVTINRSSGRGLLKVVMKAMYSMPKWHSPGLVDGKPVSVSYSIPFTVF